MSTDRPMPWVEEVRDENSPVREKFVASHLGLVRSIVVRIGSRLPASVDLDDLYQEGVLGLMEATRRFEPTRGVPFASFAEQRIHGAVLDSLRKSDWQTRANRSKQRQLESTVARLGAKLRRQPTENEIASGAGLSIDAYRELLLSLNSGPSLSLDQLESENSEKHIACEDGVELRIERHDQVRQVAEQLSALPNRELQVLQLYYYSGLNMKEVGAVLGVTESRVCQLHAQATTRLRSAIASSISKRTSSKRSAR